MSTLKEKIFNKKILVFAIVLFLVAIVCIIAKFVANRKSNETESKSGLSNIYANVSTSSINGYKDGVEEFLNLASERLISFQSEELENCYNITPDFVKENSEYQIFKFKDTAETYIIYENEIYKIGNNKRDRGTTSFALADINNDNKLELFYTYIWKVSEVSRTNVSYFDPITKKEVGFGKNYSEEILTFMKNKDELALFNSTISKDENYVDFIINARTEKVVIVSKNGDIKPIIRLEMEENFSK